MVSMNNHCDNSTPVGILLGDRIRPGRPVGVTARLRRHLPGDVGDDERIRYSRRRTRGRPDESRRLDGGHPHQPLYDQRDPGGIAPPRHPKRPRPIH
ncbi:putative l-carnitine dehydratase/bile acid-inducible protein F [Mycobacterium xenopi 4042]|uniref:Putative l-carnitine dehydratase/bile acid-inducible protein F n=1 Tax=Mycobacterium xenopi 4042 TaxID=1299334 RepID=X7ZW87_MYCXE|nr:putative l-carnitine dehydratase/bile acid-inducible protein F [Mycobacterium xenopi 4042]